MRAWRPALRIARRSVRRSLWRSVLVAVLVAVPVAGATLVDVIARTLGSAERTAQHNLGAADARLAVTPWRELENYSPIFGNSAAGAGKPDRDVRSVDVGALLPRGTRLVREPDVLEVRLESAARGTRAMLVAADVRDPLLEHEGRVLVGRAPAAPDEAALTRGLADRLELLDADGELRAGATVRAHGGTPVSVTGLARQPSCRSCDRVLALPGSALQRGAAGGQRVGADAPQSYLVDLPAGSDADALWRPLARRGVALAPRAVYTDPERYPGGGGPSTITLDRLRTVAGRWCSRASTR